MRYELSRRLPRGNHGRVIARPVDLIVKPSFSLINILIHIYE
jgi:hypothetical protein